MPVTAARSRSSGINHDPPRTPPRPSPEVSGSPSSSSSGSNGLGSSTSPTCPPSERGSRRPRINGRGGCGAAGFGGRGPLERRVVSMWRWRRKQKRTERLEAPRRHATVGANESARRRPATTGPVRPSATRLRTRCRGADLGAPAGAGRRSALNLPGRGQRGAAGHQFATPGRRRTESMQLGLFVRHRATKESGMRSAPRSPSRSSSNAGKPDRARAQRPSAPSCIGTISCSTTLTAGCRSGSSASTARAGSCAQCSSARPPATR